jgi:DNA-binding MarR family transcriptional regulator
MTLQLVWKQMRNIFESVENQVAKDLHRKHGIGLSEYRALQLLSEAPNSELRMQELSNQLSLNQSSVTRLVERMEHNDYTIRDVCPNDKRGVYAVITSHGRKVQAEVSKEYDNYLNSALDEVSGQHENQPVANCLRQIVSSSSLISNLVEH